MKEKIKAMVIIQIDSEQLSNIVQNAVRKVICETPLHTGNCETDQLLTIKQAAELLSLSIPTIHGHVAGKTGNKPIVNGSPKPIDWIKLITQIAVLLKLILEIIHHQ